jgi:hypothetical protein
MKVMSKCFKNAGYTSLCLHYIFKHFTSSHRVLRKISGPKKENGVGGWRRLHNEELLNLYTLSNIIRAIK